VRDREVAPRAPRDGFTAFLEISTLQSSREALKENPTRHWRNPTHRGAFRPDMALVFSNPNTAPRLGLGGNWFIQSKPWN